MASSKKYIVFAGLIGFLSLFTQPVWAEEREVLNCKSVREYSTFTNEFTIFKYEDQIVLGQYVFTSIKETATKVSSWINTGEFIYQIKLNKKTGKLKFYAEASPNGRYDVITGRTIWAFICTP